MATYDGFTFVTDDPVFQYSISNGTTEPYPRHLHIVKRYLKIFPKKNRVYIDVGAHIGTTIAPYSRLFHSVHGYEPTTKNFEFLKQNLISNNLTNCRIYNTGLYSSICKGNMKYHGGGNSGCIYFEPSENGEIQCITLDAQNHKDVDFIKIDTEGSELHVLRGAETLLRTYKPLVQIETNGLSEKHYGIKDQECIEFLRSLGYILFDNSDPSNVFMFCPKVEERVYCFWTGSNEMTQYRKNALENMKQSLGVEIVFVSANDLSIYILQPYPLHPAYKFLSEVHKADYLRTYFMYYYGGGYADVKFWTGSWKIWFDKLVSSDKLICGYKELGIDGVANNEVRDSWELLVGNGGYICKPQTEFTKIWYSRMITLLDTKLDQLSIHPAKHPRDHSEEEGGYPMGWNEMLGRIFHLVCYEQAESILQGLPVPVLGRY